MDIDETKTDYKPKLGFRGSGRNILQTTSYSANT